MIKDYGNANNRIITKYGQDEIITANSDEIVGVIEEFAQEVLSSPDSMQIKKLEIEANIKKLEYEHIYKMGELEIRRLELEAKQKAIETEAAAKQLLVETNAQLKRDELAHQLIMSCKIISNIPPVITEIVNPVIAPVVLPATNNTPSVTTPVIAPVVTESTNTPSSAKQHVINTAAWIKSNPPNHMEKTTNYYKRYCIDISDNDHMASPIVFSRIMKNEKYTFASRNNINYWLNK
jgi:hypothetical protein